MNRETNRMRKIRERATKLIRIYNNIDPHNYDIQLRYK